MRWKRPAGEILLAPVAGELDGEPSNDAPLPSEAGAVPWIRDAIVAGRRYHYAKKNPFVHDAINLGACVGLLGCLAVLVVAGTSVDPWLYVPLAALGFGWVYFAFFVLVVHEASHDMFFLSRNRAFARHVNRMAGWIVAGVFGTSYGNHWERGHVQHHVRPLEHDDPQRHNVQVGRRLLVFALANLLIPGFVFVERTVLRTRRPGGKSTSSTAVIVAFVCFWTMLITVTVRTIGWPPAIAMFLGLHVVSVLNQIKGGLEHGGAIGEEANPFLRSRTTLFLLRPIVMPFNISLHFEHHLNFQVPWYDLVRYHRDLESIVPAAIRESVINRNVLAQLSGRLGGVRDAAHPDHAAQPG
jgi:fatty acid desaturase